ncbi:MAG: type IV toxin-antitoxin system AbiEi family antitoxin domain-containing protein [Gammaproteobacteria bacterium]|nr:type IV toxin-antitoxin system AbiEi family antitoxin domain-containing protein [Gammaproteobacteria bacterium]
MSTSKAVNKFIGEIPIGEPFTSSELLQFGSRANIDQILSRLVKNKKITRVARGIFVKQEIVPYVGKVLPEPSKIAAAIARASGEKVSVNGAEAARQLQLTTQMPTKPIFLTSGTTRHIKVGNTEISLKHVSPRKIPGSNAMSSLVISALWYIGKNHVNEQTIRQIKHNLTDEQFQQVQESINTMPGWMANAFYNYKKEHIDAK